LIVASRLLEVGLSLVHTKNVMDEEEKVRSHSKPEELVGEEKLISRIVYAHAIRPPRCGSQKELQLVSCFTRFTINGLDTFKLVLNFQPDKKPKDPKAPILKSNAWMTVILMITSHSICEKTHAPPPRSR